MLSRLLTALFGTRPLGKGRRRQQVAARQAFLESLEQRQLLAITSITALDDVAPVLTSFQRTTVTNDNRLSLAIDTPHPFALADVSILKNDDSGVGVQQFENVPTDGAGIARITTAVLADGDYLIRARAGLYAKYFFICAPALAEFETEGTLAFRVDTLRPAATVSTTVASPTSSIAPIPFTVRFAEPVQSFQAADAIVVNGAIERTTIHSASSFTIFVRPIAPGNVSLRVPAGVAADAAANPNTASNSATVAFDPTAPALRSITRQPVSNGITNADSLIFRTLFSEPVLNVDAADFTAIGTTAGVTGVTQIGPMTFDLTLSGGDLADLDGPVKLQIRTANNITDIAGTALSTQSPAINHRYLLDNTAPTTRISAAVAGVSNAASIPVIIRFSEPVSDFSLSDIILANATASGFAGGGAVYTFNLAPQANGRVTARVPADIATDAAGNGNLAAAPLSFISDRARPTVRISTTITSPTNAASIPVVAKFSESVRGLTASDIAVANGTVSGFAGSGALYRFNVIPTSDGRVTVAIGAAVASDAAGNANFSSNGMSLVSDRTLPAADLSTSINSPTNDDSIPIRLRFTTGVSGLTLADIIVSNGTASGLTGSGSSYRFTVAPLADGPVTIRLPKGVARDLAGNGNAAATPLSILSDRTRPGARIASTVSGPTNAAEIPFRINFTEPVIGFTAGDIGVFNATINGFSGSGRTYTVLVAPTAEFVSIRILGGVAQDAAGNRNTPASSPVIHSDRDAPTTSITTTSADPTNAALIPFRIQFSEPVTGFFGSEIDISNGRLSSISGSGATYDILISPTADGLVTVEVDGAVAKDMAGNNNLAATPVSVRSDRTAPTVDLSSPLASPTNADLIPFTIVFDEPVTGFGQDDVQLTNGDIASFTANADGSYTVNVTPSVDGPVRLTVPAAAVRDAAGNDNTSGSLAVISDRTSPRVTLTYNPPAANSLVLGTVTITFTEPVTGLDIDDLKLQFPEVQFPLTADMLSGSGADYVLDLSKIDSQPGEHRLTLRAAGSDIFDLAGNPLLLDGTTSWIPSFGNP